MVVSQSGRKYEIRIDSVMSPSNGRWDDFSPAARLRLLDVSGLDTDTTTGEGRKDVMNNPRKDDKSPEAMNAPSNVD